MKFLRLRRMTRTNQIVGNVTEQKPGRSFKFGQIMFD
jgi:hypothetical protein